MRFFLLFALFLVPRLSAQQSATPGGVIAGVLGVPVAAQPMSGSGSPSFACNATNNFNALYFQTDASPGLYQWGCIQTGTNTYSWYNFKGPVAIGQTAAITGGALGSGTCQSTAVTIPGAVVGINTATANPIGQPTTVSASGGLVNASAWVSATNTVTVSVCTTYAGGLGATITLNAIPYRVLMY